MCTAFSLLIKCLQPPNNSLLPYEFDPQQELARQKAEYEEKRRLAREEKQRLEQQEEQRRREEEQQRRQREEMRQAALRLEEQERLRKQKTQEATSQMNGSVPSGSKVAQRLVVMKSYELGSVISFPEVTICGKWKLQNCVQMI